MQHITMTDDEIALAIHLLTADHEHNRANDLDLDPENETLRNKLIAARDFPVGAALAA